MVTKSSMTTSGVLGSWLRTAFNACLYMMFCTWINCRRSITGLASDPDVWLDKWVEQRNQENLFIGAVASVISATTAQLLSNNTLTGTAPWTAPAAYLISLCLSIVAVIMALHQTMFLNSTAYFSAADRMRLILDVDGPLERDKPSEKVQRAVWMYGMPQYVLVQAIFAMYAGISVMAIHPLWTEERVWQAPQKIAVATIVGCVWAAVPFYCSVAYQYSPKLP